MLYILGLFLLCLVNLSVLNPVLAQVETDCPNRYLTLINPVRSRQLWAEQSLQPLKNQYQAVLGNNFSATWLLQYDTLNDPELIGEFKGFDNRQEMGVLLEVSKSLADNSGVVYPKDILWYKPQAVFLSGYKQSDRRKLIDHLMYRFKEQFGVYPSSVGAWWIDSYSVNYLQSRYRIKTVLIVADQKSTDSYGVWGQWWGVPYYPDGANILVPASNTLNKQDVVALQWAQRGAEAAVGSESWRSNYSLQANDYPKVGKDITFFQEVASTYLDCKNPIGQITVGLETGMESVYFLDEYQRQLEWLKILPNLQSVTMSQFAEDFAKVDLAVPEQIKLKFTDTEIALTSEARVIKVGNKIIEKIDYAPQIAFADYFFDDKKDFLDRKVLSANTEALSYLNWPWFWLIIGLVGGAALWKKKFKLWLTALLFSLAAYGLVLRSGYQMGWEVFYGPVLPELLLFQISLVIIPLTVLILADQKLLTRVKDKDLFLLLLPLSFGLDFILQQVRLTKLSGKYLFGYSPDSVNFLGISFSPQAGISFINQTFLPDQLAAFLKLDFANIYGNGYLYLLAYPTIHLVVTLVTFLILRRLPKKAKVIVLVVLGLLLVAEIQYIFSADPRIAVKI